jgi:hypothetical protein
MLFRSTTHSNLLSMVDGAAADADAQQSTLVDKCESEIRSSDYSSSPPDNDDLHQSVLMVRLPHVLELGPGIYAVTFCDIHPIPEERVVDGKAQTHSTLRYTGSTTTSSNSANADATNQTDSGSGCRIS